MSSLGPDPTPQQAHQAEEPQQPQQSAIRRHAGTFSVAFFLAVAGALAASLSDSFTSWSASLFEDEKPSIVSGTDLRNFRLFDLTGRPVNGLKVEGEAEGECPFSSFQSETTAAWRCFSGDRVDDPCFAPEVVTEVKTTYLLCPGTPWSTKVWRVNISSPLKAPDRRAHGTWTHPWALEVQEPNSSRRLYGCVAAGGTRSTVLGRDVIYECLDNDGDVNGYLVGLPNNKGKGPWMIDLAVKGSTQIVLAPIKTMWQ